MTNFPRQYDEIPGHTETWRHSRVQLAIDDACIYQYDVPRPIITVSLDARRFVKPTPLLTHSCPCTLIDPNAAMQ
jgi:hypothetical protein